MKNWNIAILSTSILLISLFCCSVCAVEILTDKYGIVISKIDSPEYLIDLKKKILTEKKYSSKLIMLLEKHYELLLEGEETSEGYIEFYQKRIADSSEALLKNVYLQRMIRGLYRKNLSSEAEVNLQKLDLNIIKSNAFEYGYYKVLQTYQTFGKQTNGQNFQEAIKYYEQNKLLGFELACLYNNYGITLESKEPQTAYNLYTKGLMICQSPIMQTILLRNIKDVMRSNKSMRKQIFQDMFALVKNTKKADQRLNLMLCLMDSKFFSSDSRRQRQLMDMLATELKQTKDPILLYKGYFSLASQEEKDGNYADAIQLLSSCKTICNTRKLTSKLLFIESYEIMVQTSANKIKSDSNRIVELLYKVLNSNIVAENKSSILVLLAKAAVIKRDWKLYDLIIADSHKKNLYGYLGPQAVDDILQYMIAESSFSRDEVIRVAKSINKDVIETIPADKRVLLSAYFANVFAFDLVKIWKSTSRTEFLPQILEVEVLLSQGTVEGYKQGLQILNKLKPTSFTVDGRKFTSVDAEAWMLLDKLAILVNMNDISNCSPVVKRLEELLDKCSENFLRRWGTFACGNIGAAYVTLGDVDKAIPLLTTALADCSREDIYYGIWNLNLGLAYFQSGNLINAKKSFSAARNVFKAQKNMYMYVRASVNLSLVLVSGEEQPEEFEKILSESISIATQYKYHDDLSRAYTVFLMGIVKDKSITRSEKFKRIRELEAKCVQSSDNPTILAAFFSIVANIKNENNFPVESVISDIEKYFQYQKLFANALTDLNEDSHLVWRDQMMKEMLWGLLEELGDTKRIDYWNKIFERDRTRSVELKSQQAKVDVKMLSLLALISKFENAQQILANERSKKEPEQDKLLIQKALKLKREIEQQYELARKKLPAKDLKLLEALLADNFIIHPDSLGQLSSILPEGVACLQFLDIGENIIAYIAVKNAPPFSVSISLKDKGLNPKKFSQKLIKLRTLLQNKASVSTVNKELAELYKVLFAEIEEPLARLKVRSIVINASGILRYVPMGTLYDGKKYLIEKYQVTNITGLDLIRLSKNNGVRTISDMKAAIFADPDGSLPFGRNEGKNIAQFFANKKLYLGDQASLAEFESMAGNVNFVHLATHAVLDPNEPGKSYIQFADGKKWYYFDMMGFNIQNVDSIALSACETAISEKSTGGEIEGMAYQLLKKSPSGSVLASFWKVDDTATSMLMSLYYKHITDSIKMHNTLDRGGALHNAQLSLLKNPDTSHPYYWAAFTLFGDFR